MIKSRFLLVLGVISLLLVSLAISSFRTNASAENNEGASDFHQRHPHWNWAINTQHTAIPITGDLAFSDYHQRHPELTASSAIGAGASDYFQRHPELIGPAESSIDLTDYYFRHIDD